MENLNKQTLQVETVEKKPLITGREFHRKFQEQIVKNFVEPIKLEDGRIVDNYLSHPQEGSIKLMEGLKLFWANAEQSYKDYWQKSISQTGNQHSKDQAFAHPEIDKLKNELRKGKILSYDDLFNIEKSVMLIFELYVCIKSVKPDRIISLVNGALRLDSLANALGEDSMNYLSIHRNVGKDYREGMSIGPIYEGKPVLPGSTVLLLEDTSDLTDKRTYRDAREWLKSQGVTNAPVFFEYMTRLNGFLIDQKRYTIEQFIETQEELNSENCWNAYAISNPTWQKNSKFWTSVKSKLTEAVEADPQLFDSFFDFIRNYKK